LILKPLIIVIIALIVPALLWSIIMGKKAKEIYERCEDSLSSILGLAIHFLKTLRFDRKNPQQLFSICLYARLLELAVSCKALLEKNALVGIPILLRSMFETDIDLTNLMRSPDYYKRMNASFLQEKRRFTREVASSRRSLLLDRIRENRNPVDDLRETQAQLDRLTAEGNGPINIRCRAEFAGKLEEYLTIYNMLCLDAHNNIRSLEEWHIKKLKSEDYRVVVFNQLKSDIVPELILISTILLNQTKSLADLLGTTGIEFERYFLDIKKLHDAAESVV
jgi:hypothetical protein